MKRPLTRLFGYTANEKRYFGSSLQIGRKLTILALAAVFALAACQNPNGSGGTDPTPTPSPNPGVNPTPDPDTGSQPSIIPVSGITIASTTATVNTPLPLTSTVTPTNASNKTIVWTVTSNVGNPYATTSTTSNSNWQLVGLTNQGKVTVKATIANGKAQGSDYTQSFEITVKGALDYAITVRNQTTGQTLGNGSSLYPNNTTLTWPEYNGSTPNRKRQTIIVTNSGNSSVPVSVTLTGNDFQIDNLGSPIFTLNPTAPGNYRTFILRVKDNFESGRFSPSSTLSGQLTIGYGPIGHYTYNIRVSVGTKWD